MEKKARGTTKLKDIYSNVEYLHLLKNKKTLLQLEGDEINGKRKSEIQKKIGDELGEGTYNFALKMFDNPTPIRGSIRGFNSIKKKMPIEDTKEENKAILGMIKELESKISKAAGSESMELMLKMQENAYKIQISFYEQRVRQLESQIEKLEKIIDSEGGGGNGIAEMIVPMLQAFLTKKV